MACIPSSAQGTAKLLVKDDGIIAGVEFPKWYSIMSILI
jgi:nicotinate-nucleotide pyrophosphorylase (carboxylating)